MVAPLRKLYALRLALIAIVVVSIGLVAFLFASRV